MMFGVTKMLPVIVHDQNGELPHETTWDVELWVERGEDWFALASPQLRNKKVRVVTREMWIYSR
jgi:hypothetical protein